MERGDVSGVVPGGGTPQLNNRGIITNFQALKGGLQRALDQGEAIPLSSVQLRARAAAWEDRVHGGTSRNSSGVRAPCGLPQVARGVLDPGGTVCYRPRMPTSSITRPSWWRSWATPPPASARTAPQERLWLYVRLRRLGPLPPSHASSSASLSTPSPRSGLHRDLGRVPDPHQVQVRMWVDGQPDTTTYERHRPFHRREPGVDELDGQ